jgi:hypothetical protein
MHADKTIGKCGSAEATCQECLSMHDTHGPEQQVQTHGLPTTTEIKSNCCSNKRFPAQFEPAARQQLARLHDASVHSAFVAQLPWQVKESCNLPSTAPTRNSTVIQVH